LGRHTLVVHTLSTHSLNRGCNNRFHILQLLVARFFAGETLTSKKARRCEEGWTMSATTAAPRHLINEAKSKGVRLERAQVSLRRQNERIASRLKPALRFQKLEEFHVNVPSPTDRVAIVGAGPAGLHMAFLLREMGFRELTVLEKDSRIGGKSFTRYNYEPDVPQEFGTCYTVPFKYQELRRVAKKIGYMEFEEVPVPDRHVFANYSDRKASTQSEWLVSEKKKRFPFRFLPNWFSQLAIAIDMLWYNKKYKRLFKSPYDEIFKETNMTFKEYLDRNGFHDLIPLFSLANTVQGYGFIERVPAWYGLWWNDPLEVDGFLQTALHRVRRPASILRKGFEHYWSSLRTYLVDKWGVRIQENAHIKSVERTADIVTITNMAGEVQVFDFVIVTSNLADISQFLTMTPDESDVLGALTERGNLITTLFKCKHVIDPVPISSWTSALDPARQSRLMTIRNSAKIFYPQVVDDRESDYLISYQYVERAREDTVEYQNELKNALMEDLITAGIENIEILEQHIWPYFQHWSQDGLNRHYFVKLMELQGQNRTWFAGASTLFESVHDCMEFNRALTGKITV
jgi:protoporphyrinogen/coproporphyrinogen III oxidase